MTLNLAMHLMRFFNERPNSGQGSKKFFDRMWIMYPSITAKMFNTPYHWVSHDSKCPPSKSAKPGHYHF